MNAIQKYTRLFNAPVLSTVKVVRTVYVKGAFAWKQLPAGVRNMQFYTVFKFDQKQMVKSQLVPVDVAN